MKMFKLSLALLLVAGSVATASAAEAQKIATIDLRKTFDSYWRTKQADANLKDQAADLEKERKAMVDQIAAKWKGEVDTACGAELAGQVRTLFGRNSL